jgi:hypothetical protein
VEPRRRHVGGDIDIERVVHRAHNVLNPRFMVTAGL